MPGKRKRGRPKRRFMDVVKEAMAEVEVTEEDTVDRRNWRKKIRCGVRCLLKLLCSQFPFVMYKSRLQCHSERCNPKAILECSCIDSPGQDASKSQLPSQQCWYTFAAEYTEANWGQMKLPSLERRTMPSVRIDPMILEP